MAINSNKYLKQILLLLFVFYFLYKLIIAFSYSSDIGGIEQSIVYSISNYLQGGSIYSDPESSNYSISQYAPIVYSVNVIFNKILGTKDYYDVHQIYVIGRCLSLIFNCLFFLVFYRLMVKKIKLNNITSLGISIFMFFSLWVVYFGVRPDPIYNFIFIGIVYYFIDFLEDESRIKSLIFSSILVGLLFFAKQSAIQVIPIIPLFLLFTRRIKKAFLFGFISFLVLLVSLGLSSLIFGSFFLKNIVGGVANGIDIKNAIELFLKYFSRNTILFVLGVWGIMSLFSDFKFNKKSFISFSLLLTLLFSFVLCTKPGAGINYFNEFGVLALLFFSISVKQLFELFPAQKLNNIILTIVLIVSPVYFFRNFYIEDSVNFKEVFSSKSYESKVEFVKMFKHKYLRNNEKVMTFDFTLNSLLAKNVVLPNKDMVPWVSPFDYSELEKDYLSKKIRFVIQNKNDLTRSYMSIDFSKFKVVFSNSDYIIFENK
jgi:hypothetical protein